MTWLYEVPPHVVAIVFLVVLFLAVWLGAWLEARRPSATVLHETTDTWSALQRRSLEADALPTPPPVLRAGVGLTPRRRTAEGRTEDPKSGRGEA